MNLNFDPQPCSGIYSTEAAICIDFEYVNCVKCECSIKLEKSLFKQRMSSTRVIVYSRQNMFTHSAVGRRSGRMEHLKSKTVPVDVNCILNSIEAVAASIVY